LSELLRRAARAFEWEDGHIGAALAAFRRKAGMDEDELARFLACSPVRLNALALCRRPDPAAPDFGQAVSAIAAFIGCDAARLEALLRDP
jgi:hypothetical protein